MVTPAFVETSAGKGDLCLWDLSVEYSCDDFECIAYSESKQAVTLIHIQTAAGEKISQFSIFVAPDKPSIFTFLSYETGLA